MNTIKEITLNNNLFPLVPLVSFNKFPIVKWSIEDFRLNNISDLDKYKLKSSMSWIDIFNIFTVATPSRGKHLYFTYEEGIKNTVGIVPGVDIRSDGGIVVFPGSITEKGTYSVINNTNINTMPKVLYNKILELIHKDHKVIIKNDNDLNYKNASRYKDKNWFDIIKNANIDKSYLRKIGIALDGLINNCACPIHGGDNRHAFHYNIEEGKYYCNTRKCVDGGSIIDVHNV